MILPNKNHNVNFDFFSSNIDVKVDCKNVHLCVTNI